MNIDLVYLWVDGKDEIWARKKAQALYNHQNNKDLSKEVVLDDDAINACRFSDNNELMYSIRSVEMYAPWINHIYIVTDNQVPFWLNENNSKVTIVKHQDLLLDAKLPTFNSCVIESYLADIPNLSEYFLFANDDMFFWNKVEPNFFFDENDNPIYFLGKKIYKKHYKHLYGAAIYKSYLLTKEKFNCDIPYFPHHGIDPYRKSYIKECISYFEEEIEITRQNQFRKFEDLQRSIYAYYAIATKGSQFRKAPSEAYIDCKKKSLNKIEKSTFPLACINSCKKTKQIDVYYMKKLLNNKFSHPSEFENGKFDYIQDLELTKQSIESPNFFDFFKNLF